MEAFNTAGKGTFLPDDFPFSEYTDIGGWQHVMVGRGDGYAPLNPMAPTRRAGSSIFNFIRHLHIVSTVAMSFHIPTKSMQGFQFLQILANTCFLSLIVGILIVVRWNLIEILIYIFLMTSDIQHLFVCSLAILIFSLEKSLFKSCACFRIRLFGFCCCLRSNLNILDMSSLSDLQISSPIMWVTFLLFWQSILMHKIFKFPWSSICLFFFCYLCLLWLIQEIITKSSVVNYLSYDFFLEFYCFRSFI